MYITKTSYLRKAVSCDNRNFAQLIRHVYTSSCYTKRQINALHGINAQLLKPCHNTVWVHWLPVDVQVHGHSYL